MRVVWAAFICRIIMYQWTIGGIRDIVFLSFICVRVCAYVFFYSTLYAIAFKFHPFICTLFFLFYFSFCVDEWKSFQLRFATFSIFYTVRYNLIRTRNGSRLSWEKTGLESNGFVYVAFFSDFPSSTSCMKHPRNIGPNAIVCVQWENVYRARWVVAAVWFQRN